MAFAAFWTGLSELAPGLYIRIFMRPTDAILAIAPSIIRRYSVSFILLPVNIFSQSVEIAGFSLYINGFRVFER